MGAARERSGETPNLIPNTSVLSKHPTMAEYIPEVRASCFSTPSSLASFLCGTLRVLVQLSFADSNF